MSLHEAFSKLKFDRRMKDWNVNEGLVTEKEIHQHLKALEDETDNMEQMTLLQQSKTSSLPRNEETLQTQGPLPHSGEVRGISTSDLPHKTASVFEDQNVAASPHPHPQPSDSSINTTAEAANQGLQQGLQDESSDNPWW